MIIAVAAVAFSTRSASTNCNRWLKIFLLIVGKTIKMVAGKLEKSHVILQ